MERWLAVLLLLGFAGGSAHAQAQQPPLVILFSAEELPGVAEAKSALSLWAERAGTVLIDLSTAKVAQSSAARSLAMGVDAYQALRYGEAIRALDEGLAEAERTGGFGLRSSDLSDLFLYRGLAKQALGRADEAWEDYLAAAKIASDRQLDPVRFPPRAVGYFQRAAAAVVNGGQSQLEIVTPPRCSTLLDGENVKAGEKSVVALGSHFVHVECPEHEPYGGLVRVTTKEQTFTPAVVAIEVPSDKALVSLGRQRGANLILVAIIKPSPATVSVRLLGTGSGMVHAQKLLVLEANAKGVVAAASSIMNSYRAEVQRRTLQIKEVPARSPWYKSPWLWGAVGAGVATAIILPFALSSDSTPTAFELVPKGTLP
jgi:hypothetical protein